MNEVVLYQQNSQYVSFPDDSVEFENESKKRKDIRYPINTVRTSTLPRVYQYQLSSTQELI